MRHSASTLRANISKEKNIEKRIRLQIYLGVKIANTQIDEALKLSDKALIEARKLQDEKLEALCSILKARFLRDKGLATQSRAYCKRAIKLYRASKDVDAVKDCELELSSTLINLEQYVTSSILLYEQLAYRERQLRTLEDSDSRGVNASYSWENRILNVQPKKNEIRYNIISRLAAIYNELSICLFRLDDKLLSLEYQYKSIDYHKKLHRNSERKSLDPFNNLAGIYYGLGNYTMASQLIKKSLKINIQNQNKREIARNYQNLSMMSFERGKFKQGMSYVNNAIVISTEQKLHVWTAELYNMKAQYQLEHGLPKDAKRSIKESLSLLGDKDHNEIYYFALDFDCTADFMLGKQHDAYHRAIKLYNKIKNKFPRNEYETLKELCDMSERLGLYKDSIKWLRILHSIDLQRQKADIKNKLNRMELAHKLATINSSNKILELKKKNLLVELSTKEREAATLAVELSKKSSAFLALRSYVDSLLSKNIKKSDQALKLVDDYIQSVTFRDSSYDLFEDRASKLYKDFYSHIKSNTALSATEKKVCILLKLGLNYSEVSNLLYTSIRTTEVHCLHIRKKLKIPRNIRVSNYIRSTM
jgi:tetratricopeptide (TPR) repeat protein